MTVKPRRTQRYEYLWDLMGELEEAQCGSCRFRKNPDDFGQHAQEYPMCGEIEGLIVLEEPVEALDEDEFGVVVCTKYLPGDPWDFVPDPDQLTLGDT